MADSDGHRSLFVSANQCYLYCGGGKVYPGISAALSEPRSWSPRGIAVRGACQHACQLQFLLRVRGLHPICWAAGKVSHTQMQMQLHSEKKTTCKLTICITYFKGSIGPMFKECPFSGAVFPNTVLYYKHLVNYQLN